MVADVEVYEGGQYIKTEKMKLRVVKEFREAIIYENEQGSALYKYFSERQLNVIKSLYGRV